jgi:CubicO group peptidase (beta-lactamase class C family)
MRSLAEIVEETVRGTKFSGVVRVDRGGETELAVAYGLADRAHGIPNTVETQFATASATKTLTAVVVLGLAERGALSLTTPARSLLRDDLPLVADDVTVEHLLAHRSGIGDYLDEEAMGSITDYVMPVPVHELATTEQYLAALDGHETVSRAGERFAYNNAGFVVLALLAERASGTAFPDLVRDLVCGPAGMVDTAFLRSDELPGRAARGYLAVDGLRTNVLHLPVVGSGDGGIYTTAADVSRFWEALFAGRVVRPESVAELVRPRHDWPEERRRYGLGIHLQATGDGVFMEGYDAGVSFVSSHRPSTRLTYTVASNWSDGAWPVVTALNERLGREAPGSR